eukprot:TRINITY_DN98_c0_g1_i7.p1 TRINITY_DN98_c0_g1~~TRINITY_DN98_c0_g1_i7.p1  ORF type:complete len:463 (-),score=178.97 TRINITY_DN98_c0_g1_i7:188-1576(-)
MSRFLVLLLSLVGAACAAKQTTNALARTLAESQLVSEVLFSGHEHRAAGNAGDSYVSNKGGLDRVQTISKRYFFKGIGVTYGDLVALAGDYFGPETRNGVVCEGATEQEREERFHLMYKELVEAKAFSCGWSCGSSDYIPRILKEWDKQDDYAQEYIKMGRNPSESADELGNARWVLNAFGRAMLRKAEVNYDHFAQCAIVTYRVGHKLAQKYALEAAALTGDAQQAKFDMAMVYNAIADHFLTDQFASGHVRTPRVELSQLCGEGKGSGLSSKRSHDEDNHNGLFVVNKRGDRWWAFGDYYYLNSAAADDRKMVIDAVQVSRDDVAAAFQAGLKGAKNFSFKYGALDVMPNMELTDKDAEAQIMNTCPLFKVVGNDLMIRDPQYTVRSPASLAYWTDKQSGRQVNPADYVSLGTDCNYKKMDKSQCSCGWPTCVPVIEVDEEQQAKVSIDVNRWGMKKKDL